MSDTNKKLDFAWRYTDDPNTYVYRKEGWMYILFCLLLRRPLPPLRVVSKKLFPDKVKEIEDKKEKAQFLIGVLLVFLSIPVCVHFNIRRHFFISFSLIGLLVVQV